MHSVKGWRRESRDEYGDDVWDWSQADMTFARQAGAGFYIETALVSAATVGLG